MLKGNFPLQTNLEDGGKIYFEFKMRDQILLEHILKNPKNVQIEKSSNVSQHHFIITWGIRRCWISFASWFVLCCVCMSVGVF